MTPYRGGSRGGGGGVLGVRYTLIYIDKIIQYVQLTEPRGGGSWGSGPTHPPFGGPPNFKKREKNVAPCSRIHCTLVLNSYPDPPPPFPKSCIRSCSILSFDGYIKLIVPAIIQYHKSASVLGVADNCIGLQGSSGSSF